MSYALKMIKSSDKSLGREFMKSFYLIKTIAKLCFLIFLLNQNLSFTYKFKYLDWSFPRSSLAPFFCLFVFCSQAKKFYYVKYTVVLSLQKANKAQKMMKLIL